jgi:hypothetical protein
MLKGNERGVSRDFLLAEKDDEPNLTMMLYKRLKRCRSIIGKWADFPLRMDQFCAD